MEENYDLSKLPKEEDPLTFYFINIVYIKKIILLKIFLFILFKQDKKLIDTPHKSLLGYAFYKLEPVSFLMSNCTAIPIIAVNGDLQGTVVIDVVPVDKEGNQFKDIPKDPKELVGQSLNFYVHIKECNDLPENFCKCLQVEYTSFIDSSDFKTKVYNEEGDKRSFPIDEKFQHEMNYNRGGIEFSKRSKHFLKEGYFFFEFFLFIFAIFLLKQLAYLNDSKNFNGDYYFFEGAILCFMVYV